MKLHKKVEEGNGEEKEERDIFVCSIRPYLDKTLRAGRYFKWVEFTIKKELEVNILSGLLEGNHSTEHPHTDTLA
jgi:hypothetical protein